MSVAWDGTAIRIDGPARIEDAETLAVLLQAGRTRLVDLSQAGGLHTAVVQVLLAFGPTLAGTPSDPFAAAWLLPLLSRQTALAVVPPRPLVAKPDSP